ncbi:LysR substrate-binding domain-containing protein [Cocleimonas flava]|jgi:LysR family glycine cleavage system transcriptional activator|uniref:LysR family glycine cleavage system transcriptional activator n=1 Tax=Cocleimonas flava TaxID=634765 RepID=A0A4R1ENA8_9GAMM|nr:MULTISPECIES: LysR substrate-binding domain-containing protein [Cocleimonas]MEB8433251.1 LysR substrate-binding domain-containing protein [Cocleimonas sp. KMM 6892]MEC4715768.1 LysR substrate-binding domain-containing protein [Cocleimonas sp. KMM 6895]MEC4745229.1 LysR substrate-binding domain-containing protein [Cocleimonas sp. KMM 6896]TCJ82716.1 LysR family glycine cleavage system transcriptional activator [Cocleimonas flava]
MQRYPSTTALRAFEAIARLGSVSAAAVELNLTRSAVSHQLNMLEDLLGFALTKREGRGLVLTLKGERYALETKRALSILLDAARGNDGEEMIGKLTVSCAPGLANYWLCHQLADFIKKFPKLSLKIVSPSFPGDISNDDVDLFIAYGNGNWPEKYVKQLITIRLFPVCSPQYFHQKGGLGKPADLVKMRLFHLMDHTDWRVWLAANGVANTQLESGIVFSDANFVQSAVIAGQGLAIGDNMVSGDALAKGLLIRPFEKSIVSPRAYYLAASPEKAERKEVQAFIEWLESLISDAQSRYERKK